MLRLTYAPRATYCAGVVAPGSYVLAARNGGVTFVRHYAGTRAGGFRLGLNCRHHRDALI
jgi:hypothetical protein